MKTFKLWALSAISLLLIPMVAACGGSPSTRATSAPTKSQAAATSVGAQPAASGVTSQVVGAKNASVTLTLLTHWGDQPLQKALNPILNACGQQVGAKIQHQTVSFDQLLTKITTGRLGGGGPDIYHFYNLWLPDFVGSDLLATPPANVVSDVKSNYSKGSVSAVTYNNQVWGYPTEVDDYQLIYNKKLLQDAGISTPPATWDELRADAKKATKKDSSGKVTQAGFMLIKGWDSGVVHPFTSLLWSDGGQYVAPDYGKALFNQQPGVGALTLETNMIKDGSVNLGFGLDDFVAGKAAMTIMANWWGSSLRAGLPGGIQNAGVAPIPHNGSNPSVALQYNWLWGVDKNSPHADVAWKFIQCMNTPKNGGASPMGEFLTTALNVIPSRLSDQKALASRINDPFVKPFVDALATAKSEPIIPGAQEIKTSLQKQIEAAWFGQKQPADALNTAAQDADRILAEKK